MRPRPQKLRIVTSALTITKVPWPKGQQLHIPVAETQEVQDFFGHEWIAVIGVDRRLAEAARDLVWKHKVKPKGAIHVATALDADVEQFDTF